MIFLSDKNREMVLKGILYHRWDYPNIFRVNFLFKITNSFHLSGFFVFFFNFRHYDYFGSRMSILYFFLCHYFKHLYSFWITLYFIKLNYNNCIKILICWFQNLDDSRSKLVSIDRLFGMEYIFLVDIMLTNFLILL